MKRPGFILLAGVALALLAYGGSYLAGSARSRAMIHSDAPELAWLQAEFNIPDREFARIESLHESYVSACAERCMRIDAANERLKALIAGTNSVTLEMQDAIREAAEIRADCHRAMLEHFYEISQTMPPEQGRRYLEWVTAATFGSAHASMIQEQDPPAAAHEHHHH